MPEARVSDAVARRRQEAMIREGLRLLRIGILTGVVGFCVLFVVFLVGLALMFLGLFLFVIGWAKYEEADRVRRDMYLRGK